LLFQIIFQFVCFQINIIVKKQTIAICFKTTFLLIKQSDSIYKLSKFTK